MMWLTSVVFPEDSGPKISTIRPRGTPPIPSARSSASAPVGIASTLTVPLSPKRISEPSPKSRSICVTAASSAASFALASLAEASFKFTFLSAIWITSLPPACGQLDMGQRDVSRTPWLEFRTVERHPDAKEGLQEALRQGSRGAWRPPSAVSTRRPRCAPWQPSREARRGASRPRTAPSPLQTRHEARLQRLSALERAGRAKTRGRPRPGLASGSPSSIRGAGPPLASTTVGDRLHLGLVAGARGRRG